MGILNTIKETAGNVVKNVVRKATGKSNAPAHTQTTYQKVETDGEVTKTTVSDQPIKKKFSEKINQFNEHANTKAKEVLGDSSPHKPSNGNPQSGSYSEAAGRLYARVKQSAGTISKSTGNLITKAQKAPGAAIAIVDKTTAKVSKQNPGFVKLARRDPGSMYIQAFTGRNPEGKLSKRSSKKMKLGKKVSKKEAKILEKQYGKNWTKAVSKDKKGNMFATNNQLPAIRRENALDKTSVNFGSMFPEPNQFISSEFARQPFQPRNSDPLDIEANFMGDRGSGFTNKKSVSFGTGNNISLFGGNGLRSQKKYTMKDPYEIKL